MPDKKVLIIFLVIVLLFSFACDYIVLPEEVASDSAKVSLGWQAVATNVSKADSGDLHIDITIQNETGDWSAMQAVQGEPALLTAAGKSTNCDTVFVGTGGHRLAPGFQMRGYTTGTKAEPEIQLIYVECAGAEQAQGSKLSIDYISFGGELDYYHQEDRKSTGTLELDLDNLATGLTYPVLTSIEGVIQKPDIRITAISENIISLLDAQRTQTGFTFKWQNENPTEFALKTHIGNPPVIGDDGIIYGIFEIMDIAPVPLTPAKDKVDWTTEVKVPENVKGCYILLSVESRQMRLYVSYAVDISGL